ncbi:hypothetical protein BASA50_001289 [Batrachochytrium salamandrivorans]|uniref:Uncharacterized protein n=1 Tax=Batrachochytrium salamandrivorans TaxID=1357716 RepID=A0ABQ8EVS6_9FUNG|nr:hypothetical protein BASA50_001289 [Batrachochytrium salamandrivorans]
MQTHSSLVFSACIAVLLPIVLLLVVVAVPALRLYLWKSRQSSISSHGSNAGPSHPSTTSGDSSSSSETTPLLAAASGGGHQDDQDLDREVDHECLCWEIDPTTITGSTTTGSTTGSTTILTTTTTTAILSNNSTIAFYTQRTGAAALALASLLLVLRCSLSGCLVFIYVAGQLTHLAPLPLVTAAVLEPILVLPIVYSVCKRIRFINNHSAQSTLVICALESLKCKDIVARLSIYFATAALAWGAIAWALIRRYSHRNSADDTLCGLILIGLAIAATHLLSAFWCIYMTVTVACPTVRRRQVAGQPPSSPEHDASIYSTVMFSWFNPIMQLGYVQTLVIDNVYQLEPKQRMATCMREYDYKYALSKTPLLNRLFYSEWRSLLFQFSCQLLNSIIFIGSPIMLNGILRVIEEISSGGAQQDIYVAYIYAIGLFSLPALRFLIDGQSSISGRRVSIRLYSTLTGLIYRKALQRPATSGMKSVGSSEASEKNSDSQKQSATIGKIVNLIAVDSNKVSDCVPFIYSPITTFIQIALCTAALLILLGWPALVGIGIMIVFMIGGGPLARILREKFKNISISRDARTNATNEFLQGIRIIKFFGWEDQFEAKIDKLREVELANYILAFIYIMFNRVLWFSTPIVVSVATFLSYTILAKYNLTASLAFTSLALFNLIRAPLQTLPDAIVQIMDAWVSFGRIRDFLEEPELEHLSDVVSDNPVHSISKIGFTDAEFSYISKADQAKEEGATSFKLFDMNVTFPKGELSVIIGATGAGKSSVLMALLGEMQRNTGTRHFPTGVAYAPQQAWLMNASIRDNITFGCPWDKELYARVIYSCALTSDFEVLEGGDMTEVGEKGINLSGGQKQRISLARACYSTSPIVLLDDPLSAVDAPTARHIFDNCILDFLAGRTCILVTNAVSLCLPNTSYLVVVDHGHILASGDPMDVLGSLRDASSMSPFVSGLVDGSAKLTEDRAAALAISTANRVRALKPVPSETYQAILVSETKQAAARLVLDETTSVGQVKRNDYEMYFVAAGGVAFYSLLLFGYSLNHVFSIGQDNWLRIWAQAFADVIHPSRFVSQAMSIMSTMSSTASIATTLTSEAGIDVISQPFYGMNDMTDTQRGSVVSNDSASQTTMEATATVNSTYYVVIYALIGLGAIISIGARIMLSCISSIRAGRNIHRKLISRIKQAPMRFFDTTPLGRIINRLTKDVSACDVEIGMGLGNTMFNTLYILFVLCTIGVVVPGFLVGILPVAYGYYRIGMYYIRTSRSLKRLDSISKSPIFSHFSESISGVTTIRAYCQRQRFIDENIKRVERYNRVSYSLFVSSYWLFIRIQLAGAMVVFLSGVFVIYSGINPGFAGLCLSLSMTLTDILINFVRNLSWLEMSMNSVERINEYLSIEQEAPAIIPDHRPPSNWPSDGVVSIRSLSMKYSADGPNVLHNISVDFNAREKIGVVGRTGAGKSTLALAFYRIMEPSHGTIIIDGVDISEIGLRDLRSNMTIIPQDPVLFSGTVRYNLDPFGTMDDADLWSALGRAHLTESGMTLSQSDDSLSASATNNVTESGAIAVENDNVADDGRLKPQQPKSQFSVNLDTVVAEGGSNFSQGQRQLLCLARALARQSRVILLDEATASVDPETDFRIQATIRTEFSASTVITIAHRLKTIMDYDKIVVLDKGELVQFGTPSQLITQVAGDPTSSGSETTGIFRTMCEETNELVELMAIADKSDKSKTSL